MTSKILLVEDDPAQSFMYQGKFALEGFELLVTPTADRVLELARKESPRLILLDILLGNSNGVDILRELKASSELKKIPVIVLTNFVKREKEEQCRKLGAVDYLIKSQVMPKDVVAVVKKILTID